MKEEIRKITDKITEIEREQKSHGRALSVVIRCLQAVGMLKKHRKTTRRQAVKSAPISPERLVAFRKCMEAHWRDEDETEDTRVVRRPNGPSKKP